MSRASKSHLECEDEVLTVLTNTSSESEQCLRNFENEVKKTHIFRDNLKIKLDTKKTSVVWKYFGTLHLKDRQIYPKYIFCRHCLSSVDFSIKS